MKYQYSQCDFIQMISEVEQVGKSDAGSSFSFKTASLKVFITDKNGILARYFSIIDY